MSTDSNILNQQMQMKPALSKPRPSGIKTTGSQAKEEYRTLKSRFKFLVYENECYQEEIRNLQRKLLKLSRDKNFLLDRLLAYEKLSDSSDDSDASVTKVEPAKPKKKPRPTAAQRRKAQELKQQQIQQQQQQQVQQLGGILTQQIPMSSNNGSVPSIPTSGTYAPMHQGSMLSAPGSVSSASVPASPHQLSTQQHQLSYTQNMTPTSTGSGYAQPATFDIKQQMQDVKPQQPPVTSGSCSSVHFESTQKRQKLETDCKPNIS